MWMGKIHEMQYKFNTKVTFRFLECHGYDLNLFKKKTSKKAYIEQKEKKEKEKEIEVTSLYFLRS